MPTLIIQQRGTDESFTHACLEEVVTIGRLDNNIVQLRGQGVSRHHAKLLHDGDDWFLIDLGSGNGSFLNGLRVASEEKHLLRIGDTITIDQFDLRFEPDRDAVQQAYDEEITESDILEVKLLKKVLTALDKDMVPSLEVLNGSAEGKKIFLTDEVGELIIGRDPDCDFAINEYVISRRHAKIIKRWGGIAIRDLESKNGTFLNNRRVIEEYLHDGDRLALGTIVLMFRNPQEINLAQLEEVRPKHRPAPVHPDEIPGLEGMGSEAGEEEQGEEGYPEGTPEGAGAIEEWDELERSLAGQQPYPAPQARVEAIKRLTPIEIGMIGLGGLVLIFALITIVNLLTA